MSSQPGEATTFAELVVIHASDHGAATGSADARGWRPAMEDAVVVSRDAVPGAVTLASAVAGQRSFPLLVADRLERVRSVALLNAASWKWCLSADPAVRGQLGALLESLVAWLAAQARSPDADLELLLSEGDDWIDAVVHPLRSEWIPHMSAVGLRAWGGTEAEAQAGAVPSGDGFSFRCGPGEPRIARRPGQKEQHGLLAGVFAAGVRRGLSEHRRQIKLDL